MVKRIIIISIVYICLMLALTIFMSQTEDYFLILAVLLSFVFIGFLLREIYNHFLSNNEQENTKIDYSYTEKRDLSSLNKISTKPFLFGLEKNFISNADLYYDEEYIYAINQKLGKAIYKLSDITELSKTSNKINNRRIWQVKIKQEDTEEVTIKFAHNFTVTNNKFPLFYKKMKTLNPDVVKSEWNFLTM